jgi:hypothetical protein
MSDNPNHKISIKRFAFDYQVKYMIYLKHPFEMSPDYDEIFSDAVTELNPLTAYLKIDRNQHFRFSPTPEPVIAICKQIIEWDILNNNSEKVVRSFVSFNQTDYHLINQCLIYLDLEPVSREMIAKLKREIGYNLIGDDTSDIRNFIKVKKTINNNN